MKKARLPSSTTHGEQVVGAPAPPVSWLSLLAISTLGVSAAHTVPAEIQVEDAPVGRGPMRLVVQSFPADAPMTGGHDVPSHVAPISSAQRRVTADELRRGVRIELLDTSGRHKGNGDAQVVAWVERGDADLAYDGRTARPGRRSLVGVARTIGGRVRILLKKSAALGS